MAYVQVGPKGKIGERNVLRGDRKTGDADPLDLSEAAWDKLAEMLGYYGIETNGFLSRRMPQKLRGRLADYDHLARAHEWRAGGGDGDD
jgi:RecB family exonuclease